MPLSTMINYGFYGLLAALALFGAVLGFARGICRQTFRFITVAASAAIAFFVAGMVFPSFLSFLNETTLEEVLVMAGVSLDESMNSFITTLDQEVALYVLALPVAVIGVPVIFVALFIVISAVFELVHKIICGIFGFTRANNNLATRALGAIVGLVQGALVTLILLVPISGIGNAAHSAVVYVDENQSDEAYTESVVALYDSAFAELDANPVYKLSSALPISIYGSFQNIDINGHEINTTSVLTTFVNLYVEIGELDGADFAALTPENKAAIDEIVLTLDEDYYTCSIVSGLLHVVSHFVEAGDFSLDLDTTNAKVDVLLKDIVKLLAASKPETVLEDLDTFKSIYYLLNDSGILAFNEDTTGNLFMTFLSTDEEGKTVMSRLNNTLLENPRTAVLSKDLAEIAMMVVLANTGFDEVVAPERVESVKESLNDVISINKEDFATEEEYKEEVKSKIDTTLQENEIALDEEQVDMITDYVIENFEDKEELTDEDMAKFMSEYYDVYVKMLESGEDIPEIPEIPGLTEIPGLS